MATGNLSLYLTEYTTHNITISTTINKFGRTNSAKPMTTPKPIDNHKYQGELLLTKYKLKHVVNTNKKEVRDSVNIVISMNNVLTVLKHKIPNQNALV
tara:strand:+ start:209 stop:502 length:294 start_codon:yes stop_codon:yes gene_type:complete